MIAERTGPIGAVVLFGLHDVVLREGLRIAAAGPEALGTLLAAGAVAMFALQVVVASG